MIPSDKAKLSEYLQKVAATLDIPDHVYEDATLKYEDVGAWLATEDSELRHYSPEIYPQGSFRLGTVVRPFSRQDEYDIDLVCRLELNKEQTTQKALKNMVGERLKKREDLAKILEPSRRCWTLGYQGEAHLPRFHMDVLPAIPNPERPPSGILLTDTELTRWQKSNPRAYAEWFLGRMRAVFLESRSSIAKSIGAEVDEVPEWQVKTPLQVATQILKRHRDVYFQCDLENRPASIIISTLAALIYSNQFNVYDALVEIVRGMPSRIEKRNGRWWVANPVDPEENFADRWNEHPQRREAFERWLQKAAIDFSATSDERTLSEAVDLLASALDTQFTLKSVSDVTTERPMTTLEAGITQIRVPTLGDARHCLAPTWPFQLQYKVRIKGTVHRSDTQKELWALTNRAVPKRLKLKFVATTNTPLPYEVKWQIVNTGKEATEAGGLRGDFYDGEVNNTNVRWESTLYYGTHWVEAFIIKCEPTIHG